jgi:tetratricopeptide (TPR) repeat protein
VGSCRYRNEDFGKALIPVSPLSPDALYRMTAWFRWLRRLSPWTRLRLSERLHGHPRAVEFADDLMSATLRDRISAETPLDPEKEWAFLVESVLPKVQDQIWDDLLLNQIWEVILDEPCRRMLYRMTLLRLPWEKELMEQLGEEGQPLSRSRKTANRLADTSLLEELEYRDSGGSPLLLYALHPSTVEFVKWRFGDDPGLRLATHLRVGSFLENQAQQSPYVSTIAEAGWHLFQSKEYDRACEMLGYASVWLKNHGRARDGLVILLPYLETEAQQKLDRGRLGGVFGTIGGSYLGLGEDRKAIGYFQQHLIISRETGDRQGEGNALGNLGIAHKNLGEVRKAIGYFEQQLANSREIGDRRGEGNALGGLGNAYQRLREIRKAIGYYEQSLVIDREIGERQGEGTALGNLGLAYAELGEVRKAIGCCEQSLVIHREIGNRRGEGTDIENLGRAYHRLGEVRKAIGYYELALVINREIGDCLGEGSVLVKLGVAYTDVGEKENAKRCFGMALAIGRQIEDPRLINGCERGLKTLE